MGNLAVLHLTLQALCEVAPPILARRYIPSCCIAATRISVEILGGLGFAARPLAVKAAVWNPSAARFLATGGDIADETARPADFWVVGCGFGGEPSPNRWAGHLVAFVEEQAILDLTIGQTARPARQIDVGPAWFPANPALLAGAPLAGQIGDCLVTYEVTGQTDYAESLDWCQPGRHAPALREIRTALLKAWSLDGENMEATR